MTEVVRDRDLADPDIRESTLRRERQSDGSWVCYEPWGGDTRGVADTEHEAVIDYVERLRGDD
jgi:hypothetical protein